MTKRQKKKSEIQKEESDKLKRLAEKIKLLSNDSKAKLEREFSDSVLENGLNN